MSHAYVDWDENRGESFEVYASEIQDKTPEDVEKYYRTFEKKWTTLAGTSKSLNLPESPHLGCRISPYCCSDQ